MDLALETRLARAARQHDVTFAQVLCELEGAAWALTFDGEPELLSALAALTGGGTLRIDPRSGLAERAVREAGFEPAAFDADWRDAAVWLADLDERLFKRARKADARLIVDATAAPARGALAAGAQWVVYRHAGALGGHAELPFAALLGGGDRPDLPGRRAGPLMLGLLQRDLATLPVRLERQAAGARLLAERLGERATLLRGGALHLAGELPATSLFVEGAPLGGVVSARQALTEGTLLSVGLEDPEDLWRDLSGNAAPQPGAVDAVTPEMLVPEEAPVPDQVPVAVPDLVPDMVPEPAPAEEEAQPEVEAHLQPDLPAVPEVAADVTDPAGDLNDAQRAAFERLREWRNSEARRGEVSRFIVASNATLAEIARRAPQSVEELRQVKGMGPERTRKYADRILNMVRGLDPEA